MMALIFIGSTGFCKGATRSYRVRDSNEEYRDPAAQAREYARSFSPDADNSQGFYGAGFHFPEFFNDGAEDGGGGFGVEAFGPFPSLSESRISDSPYVVPAGTYKTAYGTSRFQSPLSRTSPARSANQRKDPILTLYDDWSPNDPPTHKQAEQPRNTKWSQEHTDDDSGEVSGPIAPYKQPNRVSSNRPYSVASVKQHYKPINPPGNTHLPGPEVRTHAHKYGVNHVYRKKPEEPNHDQYDAKLNDRRPQQFSPDPNPGRSPKPYHQGRTPNYRSQSHPTESRGRNFSPSQPDYSRNSRNFDFFTDSSNTAPRTIKADSESEDDAENSSAETPNQLDKSCEKRNKTTTINLDDGKISLQCYDCYDVNYKRPYEQCVEVPDDDGKHRKKRSVDSGKAGQAVPNGRGKRQPDDYYEGDGNYGPDSSDYRFGPEHFADEYPGSYDEGEEENESEKCYKSRKGDMLCISCENKNTGGTYQQCSYASDPKKNSYERSVSKVFGSPRLPDENRRKQVEGVPRTATLSKRRPQRARGTGVDPSELGAHPRGTSSYPRGGYGHGSTFRNSPVNKKTPGASHSGRYRGGSQGRSPLSSPTRTIPRDRSPLSQPDRGIPRDGSMSQPDRGVPRDRSPLYQPDGGVLRDRSLGRTPASTSLRGPSMGLESNLKTPKSSYLPKRSKPPASRAYSTPSPVGPDPYSYELPDPYNPGGAKGNRKNYDASYEPGYDETFADLFPELVDTHVDPDPQSAVDLAPPSYDEYTDTYSDYDDADIPVRRRDKDNVQNGSKIHSTPPAAKLPGNTNKNPETGKKTCKRTRKNKMICLECVDEKGAKTEECSYGTDPKAKHTMYREVKEMLYEPSRQNAEKIGSPEDKGRSKRKSKKYVPEERRPKTSDSGRKFDRANDGTDRQNNTAAPPGGNPRHRGETREKREDTDSAESDADKEIDKSTRKNYNPVPTDPPELDGFGEKMSEDGEFSADTEMKFDPVLGMSLPKYMLEKSEGEAIFDEVLGSSFKDE